jgi:hypothetical protein
VPDITASAKDHRIKEHIKLGFEPLYDALGHAIAKERATQDKEIKTDTREPTPRLLFAPDH